MKTTTKIDPAIQFYNKSEIARMLKISVSYVHMLCRGERHNEERIKQINEFLKTHKAA